MSANLTEPYVWRDLAACKSADPNLFFPERGQDVGPAKRICRDCPVREECLDFALSKRIKEGVWGGTSERQRRTMRPARPTAQHGTYGGTLLHKNAGEPSCADCRAWSAAKAARKRGSTTAPSLRKVQLPKPNSLRVQADGLPVPLKTRTSAPCGFEGASRSRRG